MTCDFFWGLFLCIHDLAVWLKRCTLRLFFAFDMPLSLTLALYNCQSDTGLFLHLSTELFVGLLTSRILITALENRGAEGEWNNTRLSVTPTTLSGVAVPLCCCCNRNMRYFRSPKHDNTENLKHLKHCETCHRTSEHLLLEEIAQTCSVTGWPRGSNL